MYKQDKNKIFWLTKSEEGGVPPSPEGEEGNKHDDRPNHELLEPIIDRIILVGSRDEEIEQGKCQDPKSNSHPKVQCQHCLFLSL